MPDMFCQIYLIVLCLYRNIPENYTECQLNLFPPQIYNLMHCIWKIEETGSIQLNAMSIIKQPILQLGRVELQYRCCVLFSPLTFVTHASELVLLFTQLSCVIALKAEIYNGYTLIASSIFSRHRMKHLVL